MKMKWLRKWSRILHRDIGYLFIGTTIIYGISGIALNHLADWNPSYSVVTKEYTTTIDLHKSDVLQENILRLLDDVDKRKNYKKHYYPQDEVIKIFLKGGSSVIVDLETGDVFAEFLRKRVMFYEVNFLHYNPSRWWTWFSDIFCAALIFFAITSFFIVKGKHGITGWGGIYTAIGVIIPILFLIYLL